MSDTLEVGQRPDGVRFSVAVKPRSSRSAVVGVRQGALSVALTSPPVDGAANAELTKLLAKALGVAKSAVRIVTGESGRRKLVEVDGIDQATVHAAVRRMLGE
jgi:hypothetical protein